ncbi:unnamed protein product [Prorocentrum cordatum]|uniref:Reverse transcriptase domain-containing protein n=1 Tax=Prorocentrum cordatum TaxID=2364126 RepID=A0ABN9PSB3_9DINO|nr:unnamed protein product [Polarella glacialis]
MHREFNESLLCCLPKQASGADDSGELFYEASGTRPLSTANTDYRVITSALRSRWEQPIAPVVVDPQRGFLHGRSMLRNIVDTAHEAMEAFLQERDADLVLFEFVAAFPSVSWKYLIATASAVGSPSCATNVLTSLYQHTVGQLLLRGRMFGDMPMEAEIAKQPAMPQLTSAATGKYLDFYVDPGKGHLSWARPTQKLQERLQHWNWGEFRLHTAFRIYEISVLPVLLSVVKLE